MATSCPCIIYCTVALGPSFADGYSGALGEGSGGGEEGGGGYPNARHDTEYQTLESSGHGPSPYLESSSPEFYPSQLHQAQDPKFHYQHTKVYLRPQGKYIYYFNLVQGILHSTIVSSSFIHQYSSLKEWVNHTSQARHTLLIFLIPSNTFIPWYNSNCYFDLVLIETLRRRFPLIKLILLFLWEWLLKSSQFFKSVLNKIHVLRSSVPLQTVFSELCVESCGQLKTNLILFIP